MYRVMLVTDSEKLKEDIIRLKCWGMSMEFYINSVCSNSEEAMSELRDNFYHLIIVDTAILVNRSTSFIRQIRKQNLCHNVVLYSEKPDFFFARQGILLGVSDYLVNPIEEREIIPLLNRIKNKVYHDEVSRYILQEELEQFVDENRRGLFVHIYSILDEIYEKAQTLYEADADADWLYKTVINALGKTYRWLPNYIDVDFFRNIDRSNYHYQEYKNQFGVLFKQFYSLYPWTRNQDVIELMNYILEHLEEGFSQKTLANQKFLNATYVSSLFWANIAVNYGDYIKNVKLMRAERMLLEREKKVGDVAAALGYKDSAYFSKLFKEKYGMTPSQYRQHCAVLSEGE